MKEGRFSSPPKNVGQAPARAEEPYEKEVENLTIEAKAHFGKKPGTKPRTKVDQEFIRSLKRDIEDKKLKKLKNKVAKSIAREMSGKSKKEINQSLDSSGLKREGTDERIAELLEQEDKK